VKPEDRFCARRRLLLHEVGCRAGQTILWPHDSAPIKMPLRLLS
jgi:hypothetical protein